MKQLRTDICMNSTAAAAAAGLQHLYNNPQQQGTHRHSERHCTTLAVPVPFSSASLTVSCDSVNGRSNAYITMALLPAA
jgi:hypothetical protein